MQKSRSSKGVYTLKPIEAGNVLLTAIQRFFAEGKLVDVKISSENVVMLSCHKIILASFSSYFETLLMETEGATVLNMDSISVKHAKHLRSIVNFMYGYSIQVFRKDCACLLEAAKMFGVCALIKTLQSTLERSQNCQKSQNDLLILKPTGISSLLLVNFQRFRKENKFIDAKIGFGENSSQFFLSHKLVLASFSTYFESLLQGTESCAVLGLESVDPLYVRQLEIILDYMYGQVVNLDDRQVDVLRDAAKVFGIYSLEEGELMKLCAKAVKDRQQRLLEQKLSSMRDFGSIQKAEKASAGEREGSSSRQKFVFLPSDGVSASDAETIRKGWRGVSTVGSETKSVSSSGGTACSPVANFDSPESSNQEAELGSPFFGNSSFGNNSGTEISSEDIPVCTGNALDFNNATTSGEGQALIGEDVCVAPPCPQNPTYPRDLLSSPTNQPASNVVVGGTKGEELSESTGKYLCSECGKLFKSTQSLASHISAKHAVTETEPYADSSIGEDDSCSEFENYEESEFEAGEFEESETSEGNLEELSQPSTSGTVSSKKSGRNLEYCVQERRKCPECSFETTTLKSLKSHVAELHDGSVNICQRCLIPLRSRIEVMEHLKKYHNDHLYKCKKCDKEFQSNFGLNNHLQQHLKRKFNCAYCDYVGTAKSNLNLHMKNKHCVELSGKQLKTQYACAECNRTFPYKSLYARHFKLTHLKIKSFLCPYDCDYAAVEKGALKVHIRCMHTREKPFQCPTCKESFMTQSHLARHRRTHTGSKPHVCTECAEEFVEKRDLRAHVYKIHRNDRPFACPSCSQGFLRKDHLLTHRRKIHDYKD